MTGKHPEDYSGISRGVAADNLQGVFADGYYRYLPLTKIWVHTDNLLFNCYWGA